MRKNLMGEADASITVFLSLILTCICALMGASLNPSEQPEAGGICRWLSIPRWIP